MFKSFDGSKSKFRFKNLNRQIILGLFFLFFIFSCNKEIIVTHETNQDELLSDEDLILKSKLNDVALLVAEISDKKDAMSEIKNGVFANIKNGYDESYTFKDIFYPEKSKIENLKSNKTSIFVKEFTKTMKSKNNLKSTYDELLDFIVNENIQIYIPYSENWDELINPVVTFHPIDQDTVNIGFRKINNNDGSFYFDTVIVDDEFAYKNPVMIINFCDNNPDEFEKRKISNEKEATYLVQIGCVQNQNHNYDGLFQGGDEYVFCFYGGSITSFTSAPDFLDNVQRINLTRSDIKNKAWKYFYYDLESNWIVESAFDEKGRKFGIIEFDSGAKEYSLTLSPSVTYDSATVSLGEYIKTWTSEEGWIKLDDFYRNSLISMQGTNTGLGTKYGVRIMGAGSLNWTLPISIY